MRSALSLLFVAGAAAWLPAHRNLFDKGSKCQPGTDKVRGVNLGSLFVVEPWMIQTEWASMGCNGTNSEHDCVEALGQDAANAAFWEHWTTWFTDEDLDLMVSFGLNSLRIPLGFWMLEHLVNPDEHFPQGGFAALERLCASAAERNFYIVLEMHGAPGAQTAWQAFTGKWVEEPEFYNEANFERAYEFLAWLTDISHTNPSFRTVGMIGVINEPNWDETSVLTDFNPTAYARIREVEAKLNIPRDDALHVQYIDTKWGAGNPNQNLTDTFFTAYDSHCYLKSDLTVPVSQEGYLNTSCNDQLPVAGELPLIVGEWSLGPKTSEEHTPPFQVADDANKEFYRQWWAAQVIAYEKDLGWMFWSWRTELNNDYRWSYVEAVEAGIISKDPSEAHRFEACNSYLM